MKNKIKGLTLIEMLVVVGMIAFVTYGALFMFSQAKQAHQAKEKMFVKRMMIVGGDPHQLSPHISISNIDFYVKEIKKENDIAVAEGKEKPIEQALLTESPTNPVVMQPIVKEKAPVVEQITENHYHFEALITISKYIGVGILGFFALFVSIKSILLLKKYLIVRSATKNSKKILDKFDNEFEENKNYLSFIRKISDQVIANSVLIDNRKNKETIVNLIVTNENLKERLNFLENNFVKIMK
jgi:competence protein ComGC